MFHDRMAVAVAVVHDQSMCSDGLGVVLGGIARIGFYKISSVGYVICPDRIVKNDRTLAVACIDVRVVADQECQVLLWFLVVVSADHETGLSWKVCCVWICTCFQHCPGDCRTFVVFCPSCVLDYCRAGTYGSRGICALFGGSNHYSFIPSS